MSDSVLRVAATVERVSIRETVEGVSASATLQFPPASGSNGWLSIDVTEEQATALRLRVGKRVAFVVEDL